MALHLLHDLYVSVGGNSVIILGTFGPVSRFFYGCFGQFISHFREEIDFLAVFRIFGLSRNHTDLSQRAVIVVSGHFLHSASGWSKFVPPCSCINSGYSVRCIVLLFNIFSSLSKVYQSLKFVCHHLIPHTIP